jgi:1-acyl-sn-glycerol-3-phosphate acyltransferase
VPIDRTDADSAQSALTTAERIVNDGKLIGMYPEGTRSPDGRLYKGKTGLARLALQTGVPVIPVAMIGTDVVNPPGSKMWRFGRVQVKVGKPMDFSRFEGLAGNRFIERAVIDEVMYELMRLSGQEYVDLYAADVKEGASPAAATPLAS